MGILQTQIKVEQIKARKAGNKENLAAYNILLGELARLQGSKDPWTNTLQTSDLSDEVTKKVLKRVQVQELELLKLTEQTKSTLSIILDTLVPNNMIDEGVIIAWIGREINFDKLKSPNQAIGMVKKHFGDSVDGKIVKRIIEDMSI